MKLFIQFIITICFCVLAFSSCEEAVATSECTQTIKFLGATGYPHPVLWLTEDVDGGCLSSYLLQVALEDSGANAIRTEVKEYMDWGWMDASWPKLSSHPFLEMTADSSGLWQNSKLSFQLQSPEKDMKWAEAFDQHIIDGGTSGFSWNREKGEAGIVLPNLDNGNAKLRYYHTGGLYANYDINRVYYLEKSKTLLVLTTHEYRAMGMDTMHGFLVLTASGV